MNNLSLSIQGEIVSISETVNMPSKNTDENNNPINISIKTVVIKIEDDKSFQHEFEVIFFNKKIESLNNLKTGDNVEVFSYLKANQYMSKDNEKKYYVSITGNSIKKIN